LSAESLTVKLLYAEAFRAPRPWDYGDGLGNPDLDPEKMRSFELAGYYSAGRHLGISLAAYHNTVRGLLTRETIGSSWRWVNTGRIRTFGVEPSLQLQLGRLSAFVNYTFTHSRDAGGVEVPEIARHGANAGGRYAFGDHLGLALRARYLGERPNPDLIATTGTRRVGAAFLLDATLSLWRLDGFEVQLICKNVLNTRYFHTSNRPPDRYRQPQRTILVRVGYRP
jgi:outer membrane receptor protein involved in Fe transport